MRSLNLVNTHVPAFLSKLWKLVSNPEFDYLISWNKNGRSFIIHDEISFSQKLLPVFFKHNNMASFVRQLNMYGFRKLGGLDVDGARYSRNEMGFFHTRFVRGQEELLGFIKRKVPISKSSNSSNAKQDFPKEVASSLKNLQAKQEYTEGVVNCLQQQNCLLWKQVQVVSEICVKQQRILSQWLPNMNSAISSVHQASLKGRGQLMISNGPMSPCIIEESSNSSFADRTMHPNVFNAVVSVNQASLKGRGQLMISDGSVSPHFNEESSNSSCAGSTPSTSISISNRGPGNHDITKTEASTMFTDDVFCSSETPKENEVIVDSPLSCNLENSEQTMDSPFPDQAVLECYKVLNRSGISSLPSGLLKLLTEETPIQPAQSPSVQPEMKSFGILNSANSTSPLNNCSALLPPNVNSEVQHHCTVEGIPHMNIMPDCLTPDQSCSNLPESMASTSAPGSEVNSTFDWFEGLNCSNQVKEERILQEILNSGIIPTDESLFPSTCY